MIVTAHMKPFSATNKNNHNSAMRTFPKFVESETFHWPQFLAKTWADTSKVEITEAIYFANHLREEIRKHHPNLLAEANIFIHYLNGMRMEHRAILHYQECNHARMMDESVTEFNEYRHLALKEFQQINPQLSNKA